jgi:hypothetical protein
MQTWGAKCKVDQSHQTQVIYDDKLTSSNNKKREREVVTKQIKTSYKLICYDI